MGEYWFKDGEVFDLDDKSNNTFISSIKFGENHIAIGILIGSAAYIAAYLLGRYDLAFFIFGILMAGIMVDTFVHGFYH